VALNVGYKELNQGNDVIIRVYYDRSWLLNNPNADPDLAPLIDTADANNPEPRGFCADITNLSGRHAVLTLIRNSDGATTTITVQKGNPVTTGPSKSQTAAQMAALGFHTRGDVDLSLTG
jgi:hypothetical protein